MRVALCFYVVVRAAPEHCCCDCACLPAMLGRRSVMQRAAPPAEVMRAAQREYRRLQRGSDAQPGLWQHSSACSVPAKHPALTLSVLYNGALNAFNCIRSNSSCPGLPASSPRTDLIVRPTHTS